MSDLKVRPAKDCFGISLSVGALALVAAQDEASDVVKLARGADEGVHLLHKELHGLLGVLPLQRFHLRDEANVAEFFPVLVEGVDHAVGEKKQDVPRREINGADLILRIGGDAERNAANFEAFNCAVSSTEDGIVVTGVDVFEAARR